MSSFEVVNYSLRPSKTIQRQIVFDGIRELQLHLDLEHLIYIGLGSIWFTDFLIAHKHLKIDDMVSIEASDIGYHRAVFNCPYATIMVRRGYTYDVLPELFDTPKYKNRPWLTWLDYDNEFNESVAADIRSLIENAPQNSIVLFTFNGHENSYGAAPNRPERLRSLFGDLVPDDLSKRSCKNTRMQETLAEFALKFMQSIAADLSRPGGFVPAFRIIYQDSSPMVTVGGILPTKGATRAAETAVQNSRWSCFPQKRIVAPHLTMREAALLQSHLPRSTKLSREHLQWHGFDLEDAQIETFQTYYKQYPYFAQIVG